MDGYPGESYLSIELPHLALQVHSQPDIRKVPAPLLHSGKLVLQLLDLGDEFSG